MDQRKTMNGNVRYKLKLMRAFHLIAPEGRRLDVRRRKGIALLASAHAGEPGGVGAGQAMGFARSGAGAGQPAAPTA